MEEALGDPASTGTTNHSLLLAYLGEAHLLAGRLGDALATARRALDLVHRQKECGNEAWVRRLLGEIAAQADPPISDQPRSNMPRPSAGATSSACGRSLPTATSVSVDSTGVQAKAIEPASTSPQRRRYTARWRCDFGWNRQRAESKDR
jgi:hypothetical protein